MQLVTSPRIKKSYDHAGVYNEPTGLKEVQVLICLIHQRKNDSQLKWGFTTDFGHSLIIQSSSSLSIIFLEGETSRFTILSYICDYVYEVHYYQRQYCSNSIQQNNKKYLRLYAFKGLQKTCSIGSFLTS
jgi:hypothetical protein